MKKLILIDSHAIIHRAYHALPALTTSAGEPVNAVYGFTTIFMRILRELKPDYIAAAFDLPGPTFRHVAYERYKAQRPETPSDLASQFAGVREVLGAFHIPVFQKEGYEADDIIGTIAHKMKKDKSVETVVVTGDMDALQLVRPGLKVYTMRKGISDTIIYNKKEVEARYGFSPEKLVDFKGLRGDPSDNIPGVKGIGEKTATELIKEFGSIDRIYTAVKRGTKKIGAAVALRLREGEEDARFSRSLATIRADVPIDFTLEDVRWRGDAGNDAVRAVFIKLGFVSLLKRLNNSDVNSEATPPKTATTARLPLLSGGSAAAERIENPAAFAAFIKAAKKAPVALVREGEGLLAVTSVKKAYAMSRVLLAVPAVKKFFTQKREYHAHDGKGLIRLFRECGVEFGGITFDIMLAAYITQSFSRDFSYAAIAEREIGAGDPALFFDTVSALEKKLDTGNLRFVFEKIEMPLSPILAEMEERGIAIDRGLLNVLANRVDKKIAVLTEDIYAIAGERLNLNSPSQLSKVLFKKLSIKTYGLRKTEKGGVVSTRESELEKLRGAHPIVGKILEYRELAKLKSTYIDVLPALVSGKTGRLHTTFNQTGTATGRLSSANPNLQNIPIMSEIGREIRKAFVAKPGFVLASFDYSQIELRVAAHMADDAKMIEAFQKGLDIHRLTASEIYNVPLDAVTPELRRAAKTLNFGVLYGMGAGALAESAGMSRDEAGRFIYEYFHDFSGIREYIERTKQFVREQGFVESLFGRRRYIPEINSPNFRMRSEAERMAVNMPIQSTATGDIIKMAMIAVERWVKKEGLEEDVRMLLQVHDELVFEIKKDVFEKAYRKIREVMEGVASLAVPLVVDVKAGPNWGEQKGL